MAVSAGRIAIRQLKKNKSRDLDHLRINYIRKSEAEIQFGGLIQGEENYGNRSSIARKANE